ncbi:glycine cleavage system protein P, subunit 2 [Thermococcus onnurineus NA1]|uniref:Probable glycine dehydrogenase (decarboxylating) subunit 2 n=1 Tax=Thermococcus onnurineus (strain NA1) TaxID=523850 RepID=GCSPB_THEON|nr:aminomethyl-transferring glycine dehydrogenase subunit GcvPB [Thermococcus onnurineus]B6YT12.1 RecName: Full=Probable glycine dehydrogenase (decarboxylating) subunit 2; AltName: Full=Glycine cleavage system P-protein subunit 2; AltName: Full=Glycine decarboxylase subunit 2; AltName: Full=Glycine dehydrogenase (aminomethyl-transferring) subunit 2 [Thermococcus onnurineus NA1]ACJ15699.1 glycine cleavage system protein P, subunit 2 [Thermococcus onnurineus NA1]
MFRQAKWDEPLIFELSRSGRVGYTLPKPIEDVEIRVPEKLKRKSPLNLPELSEPEVVKHYTRLSGMNYGVDSGIYPLGSCTMKYNPKINEEIAGHPGVAYVHPYQDERTIQGALKIMWELEGWLKEITGMDRFTLQPAAGANGEFTGVMIIRAYHLDRGETQRTEMLVPDSAHGTNPASAAMAGFKVIEIPSNENGTVDLEALENAVSERTAGLMLTNPNTLGIFEDEILEIAKIVHKAGGLLYYDGANLNAVLGKIRPGDMGFDIVHLNLHKTFSTPHGGGGPGSGPVGVKDFLKDYLPVPLVGYDEESGRYYLDYNVPKSIGKVKELYGNFAVMVRALTYLKIMGRDGLKEASEIAVLNANYLTQKLKGTRGYELPHKELRKHEVVFSAEPMKKETGVKALDVAKRLLDFGLHAPTIYFPLIVHEALMIEPTETVSREELDAYVEALKRISEEAYSNPELVKSAPHNTAVKRVDDVLAAKRPIITWRMYRELKEKGEVDI